MGSMNTRGDKFLKRHLFYSCWTIFTEAWPRVANWQPLGLARSYKSCTKYRSSVGTYMTRQACVAVGDIAGVAEIPQLQPNCDESRHTKLGFVIAYTTLIFWLCLTNLWYSKWVISKTNNTDIILIELQTESAENKLMHNNVISLV